jgi:hypothetical protein
LAETTARDEVRLSGVEWKPDSSTVRLRFDNFGPKGQKLVPQPYVCAYDVNGKRFSSESDADAIRSILNAPVAQANEVPINSTLPAASEIPWQKHVGDFVTAFVRTNQSTDTEATVGYYAANVDYFDQGRVDQSFIHTDVEKYNGRWPTRHDEVENNYISFQETRPGSDYLASFNLIFFAASPARRECVRGKLAVTMHVTLTGDPKITAMQQKTLQREKGTLQITNTGFTPVWHPSKQQARGSSPNTRQSPSGNNNQMDPAAAGILGGILDGLSRGGHPPLIKPRKRP